MTGGALEGEKGGRGTKRENKKSQLENHNNNNLQTISLQTDKTTIAVRLSIHQ